MTNTTTNVLNASYTYMILTLKSYLSLQGGCNAIWLTTHCYVLTLTRDGLDVSFATFLHNLLG